MIGCVVAAFTLGAHLEFRSSVDARIHAAVADARLEFEGQLKEALLIARDARTTAKIVEREHLEEKAHAQ